MIVILQKWKIDRFNIGRLSSVTAPNSIGSHLGTDLIGPQLITVDQSKRSSQLCRLAGTIGQHPLLLDENLMRCNRFELISREPKSIESNL